MASALALLREAKWPSSRPGPGRAGAGSLSERNALVWSLPQLLGGRADFSQPLLLLQLCGAGRRCAPVEAAQVPCSCPRLTLNLFKDLN